MCYCNLSLQIGKKHSSQLLLLWMGFLSEMTLRDLAQWFIVDLYRL